MKSDIQLRNDVQAELCWDPAVTASDIGVTVHDGVVTLSCHLASHAEKYAAERATRRVQGVKALAVEIIVPLPSDYQRSDADIAAAAQRLLEWNSLVPKDRVCPMVESGCRTRSRCAPRWVAVGSRRRRRQLSALPCRQTRDAGLLDAGQSRLNRLPHTRN